MEENRRPVSTRDVPLFQIFAKKLVSFGLTPNEISILSAVFAAIGGFSLSQIGTAEGGRFAIYVVLSLAGIQFRLVCNLIDGLMAVEGGLKTPTGELYNDIPDRVSDLFLFVGAAASIPFSWGLSLGWLTAVLAILTAYVRVLGASMQQGHDFGGPTAKQHRMFILNLVILAAVLEKVFSDQVQYAFAIGLIVIATGSLATVTARIQRLAKKLNQR